MTTARRRAPRTTAGLRCVAVSFAYLALSTLLGLLLTATLMREISPQSNIDVLLMYGLGVTTLFVAISVGLFRRIRTARWAAVGTSIMLFWSVPVVGIALLMYLTRPELDGSFE
jgi:hypothetical protein